MSEVPNNLSNALPNSQYLKKMKKTSMFLSKILRHRALDYNLQMDQAGFVKLQDIFSLDQLRDLTINDIINVVETNSKKRFEIKTEIIEGIETTFIRATQGHSISFVNDELLLTPILSAAEIPICLHGTYCRFKDSIIANGLKKMSRNHIHFASGLPESGSVISGIRGNVEILVYIDSLKCFEAGMKFFRSSNGVILCRGLGEEGVIPPEFIQQIIDYNPAP